MTVAGLLASGAVAFVLLGPQAGTGDLSNAKALYAAASYEEALAMLALMVGDDTIEPVNELRALCQLALGRTEEAEQSIATLVLHNPTYQLPQSDVSPKLVALFHDVRRRTLPSAARAVYEKAKSSYDKKAWSEAAAGFTVLLKLLADPDVVDQAAALADLKQLGEGFLTLAQGEIAAIERRAAEAAAAEKAREIAADEARKAEEAAALEAARLDTQIYSAADAEVTPPVEVRRVMPRWVPPTAAMSMMSHTGLLEIIIDENGVVTSSTVLKPIAPSYDQALKDAAPSWRYKPAMRAGRAVRYRQRLEIVLRPAP